ncbi:MAG: hypothetical protein OCD01_18210 [Fibrobacterales bacterium]
MKAFLFLALYSIIAAGCIFEDTSEVAQSCEGVYSKEESRDLTYTLVCQDYDDLTEITETLSCSLEETLWYTKYRDTFVDHLYCDRYDDADDIDEKCHINDWSGCDAIIKNTEDKEKEKYTCDNDMNDEDCQGYIEDCECKNLYDALDEEDWDDYRNTDGDDYCGRFDDHFDEEYCKGLSISDFENKYNCTFYEEGEYESNKQCPKP